MLKKTENRRNGYTKKTLKTSQGEIEIESLRDRDGSFEPILVPKRKKDVSAIEGKVVLCQEKVPVIDSSIDLFNKIDKFFFIFNLVIICIQPRDESVG